MGKGTILLLMAVVAALGITLYMTSEKPPLEERAESMALDGRSLRQCKRFRWQFHSPPAPPFEIERRDDGTFYMMEPIEDRAAMGFMQQIVQVWDSANLLATEFKNEGTDLVETGLDAPGLTFFAEWPDGHRIEYELGKAGPLGSDRFLRRDGKIWRGGNGLYESMRMNRADLRDRQVFLHREVYCQELRVEFATPTGKRETLRLARRDGDWRLLEPVEGRAAPAAAVKFVTAILSLRADQFIESLVRVPPRDPDVVVDVTGARGTEKLEMWVEQGAAFGQLPGRNAFFQCDPRTFEAAFINASADLRARTLIGLDDIATEMAEVAVDPGQGRGDRVRLRRDSVAKDWGLVEPVTFPVNPTRANELVQAINNLRAVEFVDGKKIDDPSLGLGPGRLALSVRGFDEREVLTLWLGATEKRADAELVYAVRSDETETIMLVPGAAVERLRREWPTYCARQVLQIPVQIGRLVLQEPDESRKRVYRLADGHWAEEGKPGRRDDVGEFCNDELVDLKAKAVVDLRGDRFGAPDWLVLICRGNGDVLQTLRVWDRAELPLVVQRQLDEEVGFELGLRDSKQLRELWR